MIWNNFNHRNIANLFTVYELDTWDLNKLYTRWLLSQLKMLTTINYRYNGYGTELDTLAL